MPALQRRPDWEPRLIATIEAACEVSFSWGTHDCFSFACNCAEAMTGVDLAAPFYRGKVNSRTQAYGRLKRYAGGGLQEAVDKIARSHGMAEVMVTRARRGDWAMMLTPDGDALGVVLGNKIYIPAERGIHGWLVHGCHAAWRVG